MERYCIEWEFGLLTYPEKFLCVAFYNVHGCLVNPLIYISIFLCVFFLLINSLFLFKTIEKSYKQSSPSTRLLTIFWLSTLISFIFEFLTFFFPENIYIYMPNESNFISNLMRCISDLIYDLMIFSVMQYLKIKYRHILYVLFLLSLLFSVGLLLSIIIIDLSSLKYNYERSINKCVDFNIYLTTLLTLFSTIITCLFKDGIASNFPKSLTFTLKILLFFFLFISITRNLLGNIIEIEMYVFYSYSKITPLILSNLSIFNYTILPQARSLVISLCVFSLNFNYLTKINSIQDENDEDNDYAIQLQRMNDNDLV